MSAEAMDVPRGEVLLDGRVMRPDGSWGGVKVAGQVVRGQSLGAYTLIGPPVADVYWFETFMERLTRDLQKRDGNKA